jgi:hypothetical protein
MSKFVAPVTNAPQLTQGSATKPYATNQGFVKDSLGNYYYVTMAQLGAGDPVTLPSLVIYKSTDSGHTWAIIATDSNRGSDDGFGVSIFADVLYICIINSSIAPNGNLGMYQYNTATNTFAADDYGGPVPTSGNPSLSLAQTVLSDGTIVMAFVSAVAGTNGPDTEFAINTHNMDTTVGTSYPLWLLKEATSDRVHLFLLENASNNGGIWHISLSALGVLGTLQNPIASTANLNLINSILGHPTIFGADTQIEMPYVFGNASSGHPGLTSVRVLRGTVAADPVWTDEQAVPANFLANFDIEPFLGFGYFTLSAINVSGGITIIFMLNNNEVPAGNNVQSYLYTVSTTGLVGGWGTPALLFTAPFPSAFSSPYVLPTSASGYGVVIGTIAVTGGQVQYGDLRLFFLGNDAARVKTCLGDSA